MARNAPTGAILTAALKRKADQRARAVAPLIAELQTDGTTTLAGIAAALNVHGLPSPRGCAWRPQTVARAIARIAAQQKEEGPNN